MRAHDEQSKNGARGLENFDIELAPSPTPSENGGFRCHVCKEPERSIVKPLMPCIQCKARFHPGCHNPPVPTTPRKQQWFCSRCTKSGRSSSAISRVGHDTTNLHSTDSEGADLSTPGPVRCTFSGCQKRLFPGSQGLSLCALHRTSPSKPDADLSKSKPRKSLFGTLKYRPVRKEIIPAGECERPLTAPSFCSPREKEVPFQKWSGESPTGKTIVENKKPRAVARKLPTRPNLKRKRSSINEGATRESLGEFGESIGDQKTSSAEAFTQIVIEKTASDVSVPRDDETEGVLTQRPPELSEDFPNHCDEREEVREGTSAQVRTPAELLFTASDFTEERRRSPVPDYDESILDDILAAPEFPMPEDVVTFADAKKMAWGHVDPRTAWQQEHEPGWIEEKMKEIAARGGRKAQFGVNLSAQMVKERLEKGWHPNQSIEAPADGNSEDSVTKFFGLPRAMNPTVVNGELVMLDDSGSFVGAGKKPARKFWKVNG